VIKQFKVKPVCPTCGSIQGVIIGDQPPGTMKVRTSYLSLPGIIYSSILKYMEIKHTKCRFLINISEKGTFFHRFFIKFKKNIRERNLF
jgi:hypothetical protein